VSRINRGRPSKAEITALRPDAYALLDFPELLDKPEWRRVALHIIRVFVAEHPYPPFGPRHLATMVDEVVDSQLKRGVPLEEAVQSARSDWAKTLRRQHTAVKMAHLRYGKQRLR
jgi:hypothetical protein